MVRKRGRKADEPPEAPGDLRIVQEFVNTVDRETGAEDLSSARALAAWLKRRGLLDTDAVLQAADLEQAVELRKTLRTLIAANIGLEVGPATFERLDQLTAGGRLRIRFARDGVRLEPASRGFDDALVRLAAIVFQAQQDGFWPRFKVCALASCRTAFYDVSPNRVGKWCTGRCGSYERGRAHRRTRKYRNRVR